MPIGKDTKNTLNSDLTVDNWKTVHTDVLGTGSDKLEDVYDGQISIEMTNEHKYLGFIPWNTGNNIEEGFLRELLKTGRGCPITQL